MNHCRDCKYFGAVDGLWADHDGLKPCGAIKMRSEVYDYDDDMNYVKKDASVRAVVVDGSDYYAALRVAEDFGCVMFEAKS